MPERAADGWSPPSSPQPSPRIRPETASAQWRNVADRIRPKVPKLAQLMDTAEEDVLAYMTFPRQHWTKLHSTNPI